MSRASEFWQNASADRQALVEMFERNIEYDRRAYDYVTSRRMCSCLDIDGKNRCSFPLEGKVVRISYEGPAI